MPNPYIKKDNIIIIGKKIKNLNMWLLVWNKISPPSVEYIAKALIVPSNNMQINKM